MAIIVPFEAVRPTKNVVDRVASYPYDVVDFQEARTLVRENPSSFLHIVRAEVDLPIDVDCHDERVYRKARDNYTAFKEQGILVRDRKKCFYLYRLTMNDHVQDGIVACVPSADYERGKIKKHELTRSDKLTDRIRHFDTVNAQTGPVFLTYRARESINRLVDDIVSQSPEYDFTADDGIRHTVWIIDDDAAINALCMAFDAVDSLYIADGHHRTASAAAVAKKRGEDNPRGTGNEAYNYIMTVLFPHDQLTILAYNRVVTDLLGLNVSEFIRHVEDTFTVQQSPEPVTPGSAREFGMYMGGTWYRLQAKDLVDANNDSLVSLLDVEILERRLLSPVLGIEDLRTDERIGFVGGIKGTEELMRLVDKGAYAVAFSLYPVTTVQLMAVSDAGAVLPPKSTWFEPKLRSGLFIHEFEGI